MANTFIAVEGPQDVELIAALFESIGFYKVVKVQLLDHTFCRRLISTDFPVGGDLHRRVSNPMFLFRDPHWLAIQAAGTDTPQLVSLVGKVLNALKSFPDTLDAIGIVRDADELLAENQYQDLRTKLSQRLAKDPLEFENYQVSIPATLGEPIAPGNPDLGVFILPDNRRAGSLEDLLLVCGNAVYPELIQSSQAFTEGVNLDALDDSDTKLIKKPSGPKKAIIAAAVSILKPGMSLAASLDQNRWFSEKSFQLAQMVKLTQFLRELCQVDS